MSKIVLDASAILAVICQEDGAKTVAAQSQGALVSTANLAEVYSKAVDVGLKLEELRWGISRLQLVSVPLNDELALMIGALREATRRHGLSLGDRACLALAIDRQLPVLTADQRWKELKLGIAIKAFR